MKYYYAPSGKITNKTTQDNARDVLLNRSGATLQSIVVLQDIDINEYYVDNGVLTPAEFIPYTLSADTVAVDEDVVVTVAIGTKYSIRSSETSLRGVVDDGTLEFSSGIPGEYLIELTSDPYKPTYLIVEVV